MFQKSIYVVPHILCVCEGCEEKATWGVNWASIHCDTHKTNGEEPFVEKRCKPCGHIRVVNKDLICKPCGHIHVVNKDLICKPCKVEIEYAHPHFTIRNPSLRATKSSPNILTKTLRSTKSSPEILLRSTANSVTSGLKEKLAKIQEQARLQNKVTEAKTKLVSTRSALALYSLTDMSPSKIAARDNYAQAEKEVEEACRAWCYANRG